LIASSTGYRTTSIVIWPTSKVAILKQATKNKAASWNILQGVLNHFLSAEEQDELDSAKAEIIIRNCLDASFFDDDVVLAGRELSNILDRQDEPRRQHIAKR